ncbi:MAG TPA: adenylate/guanylate cyclase domain-containing protein [Mycobacteriales bacterium]|nr:adenylate/guanylate cyclase domain-containing protein [Mycobacteriales bacterium]
MERSLSEDFLLRLAEFCTLILFDKRGVGLSDPIALGQMPTLEDWGDDLQAVLDAAGHESAFLFTLADAGPMSMLFAASHPEKVTGLILADTTARFQGSADFPCGLSAEVVQQVLAVIREAWGTEEGIGLFAPSLAHDPDFVTAYARYQRMAASPGSLIAMETMLTGIDVRATLPLIHVPTLVLHREDAGLITSAMGRHLADHIPHAEFELIPGPDPVLWASNADMYLDKVEEFVTGERSASRADRVLATVMFTDIVGSTEQAAELGDSQWLPLLERHRRIVREELKRHNGREIETAGDGFLFLFAGPAKAIEFGAVLVERVRAIGLELRVGIHAGECSVSPDAVQGIAVHVAARMLSLASPSEICVSSTVKDLALGSGIKFEGRGSHLLKGLSEEWQVFAVRR